MPTTSTKNLSSCMQMVKGFFREHISRSACSKQVLGNGKACSLARSPLLQPRSGPCLTWVRTNNPCEVDTQLPQSSPTVFHLLHHTTMLLSHQPYTLLAKVWFSCQCQFHLPATLSYMIKFWFLIVSTWTTRDRYHGSQLSSSDSLSSPLLLPIEEADGS